jgi:hypothetical protein
MAAIPLNVTRAVVVCDAQASIAVLERGSSIPDLQQLAASVFRRQLRYGRILFFCWMARNELIVEACDDRSRLVDNHAFQSSKALFWRANEIAEELFGQDFQVDAMADMHNVMPGDSWVKLPHYSRWLGPHSCGVDALLQDWTRVVSWVNPPFSLLERVICLLRQQRAVAAVVLPKLSRARWSNRVLPGAEGVVKVWDFDPCRPEFAMRGRSAPQRYRSGYAVVFLDFRSKQDQLRPWRPLQGARELRLESNRMEADLALGKRADLTVKHTQLGLNGGVVGDWRGG